MSTISTNFSKIWLQERSLIFVTATNGAAYCDIYNGNTRLARYTLNSAHKVTIDITDYMRAYPSTTSLKVQIAGESAVTISTPFGGLINPEGMLIPPNTMIQSWPIVPPSMILQDAGAGIIFECFGFENDTDPEYIADGVIEEIGTSNGLPTGTKSFVIAIEHEYVARYAMKQHTCGKKYADVQWVSSSGVTRRHTFEVRDQKFATRDSISLQTLDGSYNTRKGREEGFSLYLEDLTAYDLWYYSDIITSSSVMVSLDGTNWRQVDVVTNSQTIPNGDAGEGNKLSISVKYRKYDAI